jgi:hypothetical protein
MPGLFEDDAQRLARNINDLLQELRVAQAGVQILFGFLFAVVFTDAYRRASALQHGTHLVAVLFAVLSVVLLTAPVAWHRLLFRRGQRQWILQMATGLTIAGLACLAIAMSAAVFLVFDVMLGGWPAGLTCGLTVLAFAVFWFAVPLRQRYRVLSADPVSPVGRDSPPRAGGPLPPSEDPWNTRSGDRTRLPGGC